MNQPRLSVITPVYNVENYLRGSVDSVLNQTFADLELILVDDGSTNESSVSDKYLAVTGFLNSYAYSEYISLLNIKHRMLMYSFKYCPPVHRFYAFMSAAAKKIQS